MFSVYPNRLRYSYIIISISCDIVGCTTPLLVMKSKRCVQNRHRLHRQAVYGRERERGGEKERENSRMLYVCHFQPSHSIISTIQPTAAADHYSTHHSYTFIADTYSPRNSEKLSVASNWICLYGDTNSLSMWWLLRTSGNKRASNIFIQFVYKRMRVMVCVCSTKGRYAELGDSVEWHEYWTLQLWRAHKYTYKIHGLTAHRSFHSEYSSVYVCVCDCGVLGVYLCFFCRYWWGHIGVFVSHT